MSSLQKKRSEKKHHSDRCANPYKIDGHVGKNLRKMSKVMLKTFSNMPDSSKICISCVKLYHEKNKLQSDPYIATESNFDVSIF